MPIMGGGRPMGGISGRGAPKSACGALGLGPLKTTEWNTDAGHTVKMLRYQLQDAPNVLFQIEKCKIYLACA